jgi:superfamily I DNA and/or RNA helicase
LRIKGFERERRAIWVEELPKSEVLKLPAYTKYLKRQKDMLENLRDYPLAHHEMLLNLTTREEDNNNLSSQWPDFTINRLRENEWNRLTQDTNGTDTQRDFVERALSTEDFCLMQGPPGSGKTTAICELIIQLAKRGDSVLLCGSTQASIDNVLNRVCDEDEISVLRIGNQKNIFDENVKRWSLENQVSELKMKLRSSKEVESMDGLDLATNLVLQKTNLTCGTVEGILNHPLIGARTTWRGDEIQRPQAIWDYLIVDEASKTTFHCPCSLCKALGSCRRCCPITTIHRN